MIVPAHALGRKFVEDNWGWDALRQDVDRAIADASRDQLQVALLAEIVRKLGVLIERTTDVDNTLVRYRRELREKSRQKAKKKGTAK